ncbi:putative receptor-like protein kinase At2g23200 [Bidens hawaiensis]|uniref:putative receptor-like protein kinase At2g23200 n=1 Tax=Bidens hawaiensis TaxID=980011 RepID=UPI00404AC9B0
MLTAVKHDNIVSLLGYCFEAFEMILITDDLSYGYLVDYLENVNKRGLLTWEIRLKISNAVAWALNYLHHEIEDQKVIINRQISSLNIGLDEEHGAKIFDFGLSIFLPPNQKDEALYVDGIGGKEAYIDPEYKKTCRLKRESDVYSFGVLLFEILFGAKASDPRYDTGTDGYLAHVARQSYRNGTLEEKIDPIIKEETCENNFILNRGPNKDSLHTYIEIAYKCVMESQDKRPTMKEVVKELEKALSFQANKDKLGISLEVIQLATKNFNHRIGGGGFGNVYIGNLKGETIVAKRLDTTYGQGKQQFLTELQILSEYKHENIIGLIGYCDENVGNIIVYEYASRGSLDNYLKNVDLTWIDRLNICIDVARALDFLHGGDGKQAKVIHRDIKTANILLNTH